MEKIIKVIKIKTIVMTGDCGGNMAGIDDVSIILPSNDVQRIREAHIKSGIFFVI